MINDQLPPNVGKHECQRKDGSYGYVCNACGYPVGDHDGYCSECGARVAGTLFYYGNHFKLCDREKCFPCFGCNFTCDPDHWKNKENGQNND